MPVVARDRHFKLDLPKRADPERNRQRFRQLTNRGALIVLPISERAYWSDGEQTEKFNYLEDALSSGTTDRRPIRKKN
jgi:hypothetical protein